MMEFLLASRPPLIDIGHVAVSLFMASWLPGCLLLHRLMFPQRYFFLPTWKSAYIAAAGIFVVSFIMALVG